MSTQPPSGPSHECVPMVLRQFAAFDNEALVIDAASPHLTPGTPIINNSSTPVGTVFTFTDGFAYQSIVLDDTSGSPDVFDDNRPCGHQIVEGRGLVDDGTQVESESYHFVRQLDENGIPTGPRITINVFSKDRDFEDIWGMAADTQLIPGASYVKIGGSNNGDSRYEDFVPCFTDRAVVLTKAGLMPIVDLEIGDEIATRDNGFQAIAWIGSAEVTTADQIARPHLAPVRFQPGALGLTGLEAPMMLSPNHRVLVTGPQIQMSFGEPELLVAAKHLAGLPGIDIATPAPVTYMHILFERHEVIMADGVWSESFQPGGMTLRAMDRAQSDEVLGLFPQLLQGSGQFQSARAVLTRREAEVARSSFPA